MGLIVIQAAFASEATDQAWQAYLRGNDALAQRLCERGLREGPTRDEEAELLYVAGMSLKQLRQYPQARASLGRVAQDHASHPLAPYGKLSIGDSHLAEEAYGQAVTTYQGWLEQFPRHPAESVARFHLGLAFARQGKPEEAKAQFQQAIAVAPSSQEAMEARQLLDEGLNFTVQVGAFADRNNAQRLAERLHRKGYDSYIQPYADGSTQIYRVRVGRFASRAEAQVHAERLRRQGFPTRLYP